MDFQPYIPGLSPAEPGPLSRFLPALEEGVISAWLSQLDRPSAWLLDPFGFAPRLALEAARSGYRVLVTANNPVTRFLLETFAHPPAQSEFTAALADLSAIKKGEERLGAHLQSLYLTTCEKCNRQIHAHAFLWRKGEDAPYARIYECNHCGDSGEHPVTEEDIERAKKIAETDSLHRSRAFEKVVALNDEDRFYAEEAIQHYLPRPLYVLTTIANRLDSLNLSPERKRALTALTLIACDAGNTLWAHPAERPRPKQLSTPNQFREHNVWMMLERGLSLWAETGSPVPCEVWPKKIPESGGILIYEGRLKDLAHTVKKEIPITAVIGSVPRPNQAFWTLSALWAGWLWGKEAVEPYKIALRRRRYDWAWNATALHSAFNHLKNLLPENVPFFGLLAEPEPAFLASVFTAANAADFSLQSVALRTEHDPVQVIWKNGQTQKPASADTGLLSKSIQEYLAARGEPAPYLHVHTVGLIALAEAGILKKPEQEFDEALRSTHALFESALKKNNKFVHYSTGESVETGMWGLAPSAMVPETVGSPQEEKQESLSDRVEVAIVNYLQKKQTVIYLEIENDLNPRFTGLFTPSKGLIYAVLNSYAEREAGNWKLRAEDVAAARRAELNNIQRTIEKIGSRLGYQTRKQEKLIQWEENGKPVRTFKVLASALLGRALQESDPGAVIVIPGGRAALAAYKQERDPSLAAQIKKRTLVKNRLLRALLEVPILTRETFEEQIASDPIERSAGQMMMF
jgi:23S rRNA pseudoU1915 N3-methylase RlmH